MIAAENQEFQFENNENVKILIVENESEAKDGLVKMLARRFKNIYTASDGEEGFLLYKQTSPEIIITDIKMAPMDGLDLIKEIRKSDQQTQIIITTAHDENDYFIQAIEYGVNHFILKPIYKEQFLIALQKSVHQATLEEQIKKQKLFTKTVLDFQEDLIMTFSVTNKLLDCNEAFLQFVGAKGTLKSININDFLATEQAYTYYRDFYEIIHFLLQEKDKKHYKVKLVNDRNEEKTFLVKATRIVTDEHILVVCTDITELEEEIKKNEFLANRDALTKLYNRYRLESLLDQEIRRAKRYKTSLSMILLDIDHFKTINDLYGHSVGDRVLIMLANLIQERIRDTDLFARWGGEEFVLLLPETDEAGARLLAEALREKIASHSFMLAASITSSFGICQYEDDYEPNELIRFADIALYSAKNRGRNCVVVYDKNCYEQRGMFDGI